VERHSLLFYTSFVTAVLRKKALTVVSRIYAPRFATLALVESVRGAYMQDLTFYLVNMFRAI